MNLNQRNITITGGEVLAVVVAMLLTVALVGYLFRKLETSRSNEREMSKRYQQLIQKGSK